MKKLTTIITFTIATLNCAIAQEQLSVKKQADKLYYRYEYFKSLSFYLKLADNDNNDSGLEERIGDCYRNIKHYDEAETWYQKAAASPQASEASHYYYAEVLQRNKKFDLAKKQYVLGMTGDTKALVLKLSTCDSAARWMKQKPVFSVKNSDSLNTEYSDWGLNFDRGSKIFTSDRKNADEHLDYRTGNNWFKLFYMPEPGAAVRQLFLISALQDIFKESYHVGPIAYNAAADTAYITVNTSDAVKEVIIDHTNPQSKKLAYTRRLKIVMASRKSVNWTIFANFPYSDILKYSVGNAALSKNGKEIYFTSDMPGGLGGTDIWYCERQGNGTWGKPVNCGPVINTKEDEDFPTIGGDSALYYSSKGLPGMGGFDIYKAQGEKAQWAAGKNLKYPINSTSDDFYLTTNDGVSGYLSSNREGGKGNDDIYSFGIYKDTIPSAKNNILAANVKNGPLNQSGPGGTIGNDPLTSGGRSIQNSTDGSKNKGTEPVTEVPDEVKSAPVLKTIYYDLNKAAIRPDAAGAMDKLVLVLKQQPSLKIAISSYTDSRASEAYNIILSQLRAEVAVAYLVDKGIDPARLTARYYGKTHLVTNCPDGVNCTEAEHQLNRRTEFAIVK